MSRSPSPVGTHNVHQNVPQEGASEENNPKTPESGPPKTPAARTEPTKNLQQSVGSQSTVGGGSQPPSEQEALQSPALSLSPNVHDAVADLLPCASQASHYGTYADVGYDHAEGGSLWGRARGVGVLFLVVVDRDCCSSFFYCYSMVDRLLWLSYLLLWWSMRVDVISIVAMMLCISRRVAMISCSC